MNEHGIVVISGPSGSGKSTLINRLMKRHREIVFSVSHTTRPIRGQEVDGKDYHFVDKAGFDHMVDNDEFVEWANVYENFYGTSYKEVEGKSKNGVLVLDIDVQGGEKIKKKYPDALLILVVPPSLDALRQRLLDRKQDSTDDINTRLQIAKRELRQYENYNYIVINDQLENAFTVLDAIYTAFNHTVDRHKHFMNKLLAGQSPSTQETGG